MVGCSHQGHLTATGQQVAVFQGLLLRGGGGGGGVDLLLEPNPTESSSCLATFACRVITC